MPKKGQRKAEGRYEVLPWGPDRWIIVERGNPNPRPVEEKYYTEATHAHRRKRKLNQSAKEIDEMIKRDGAIII